MDGSKKGSSLEEDADWEIINSDSDSLDIYSDAMFLDAGPKTSAFFILCTPCDALS